MTNSTAGRVPAAIKVPAADAKADWDGRILIRRDAATERLDGSTAAPTGLVADAGRGQVTLRWNLVPGAVGYVVHTAPTREGPWEQLDHGGGDHLVMPPDPYTDTTGEPGVEVWYAVASTAAVEARPGRLSEPVAATPLPAGEASVEIVVDAGRPTGRLQRPWRPMIGSEHLSQLAAEGTTAGRPIGREFADALRIAHDELNIASVRAHGILLDELAVYREVDGRPVHDFTGIDRVYDELMSIGIRPVVELGFMPRDLAADPAKTVFQYAAIVSPPKDLRRWEALVLDLAAHFCQRYGRKEVTANWSFEVWNEANLEVFWSGDQTDYLDLYDASARAVKSVDPRLRVGGPSSAAGGWLVPLLEHTAESNVPLDFLSTHSYGNPPFDAGESARSRDRPDLPVWWTEWGPGPRHGDPVADSVFAAAFLARGMKSVHGRAAALSHWVISDHFEELGRPKRLFHGGFGLLTVGNLRKPRFWSVVMLERLGDELLACEIRGDGAGSLVDGWATRDSTGRIALLLWNGTLDQGKIAGTPALSRAVTLRLGGLAESRYALRHLRVDDNHSNIRRAWQELGDGDWPDESGWRRLQAADRLEELEPERELETTRGSATVAFALPMPAVSLLELTPR